MRPYSPFALDFFIHPSAFILHPSFLPNPQYPRIRFFIRFAAGEIVEGFGWDIDQHRFDKLGSFA